MDIVSVHQSFGESLSYYMDIEDHRREAAVLLRELKESEGQG